MMLVLPELALRGNVEESKSIGLCVLLEMVGTQGFHSSSPPPPSENLFSTIIEPHLRTTSEFKAAPASCARERLASLTKPS